MNTLFYKIIDLRRGEERKVLLMFIYLFLIIASLLILKSLRDSFLLTQLGISQLPHAFLLIALSATSFSIVYIKISKVFKLNKLLEFTLLACIISLIVFRIALFLNYQARWFIFSFYVWVALFGVLTTSQFWLLANYVFDAREAKRLFGFIGAGGILGGIFGGYLTTSLVLTVGSDNMLLICVGFLSICIFILMVVWEKYAQSQYREKTIRERKAKKVILEESPIKLILNSRHLCYVAAIVGVGVIVASLVHFQFSDLVNRIIRDKDRLTAFFGFWLSTLSVASLLIQFLITGRIIKTFGVITSLFFLPIGLFIGSISILIQPALWSAIVIKVSDGSLKQSINRAGIELLALPIPSQLKKQSKMFTDVFIDSIATGISGLLLLLLISQLKFSSSTISILTICFIICWIILIYRSKYEYIDSFRTALEKRTIDLDDQAVNIEDASVIDSLIQFLKSKNDKQVFYVLRLIENVKNKQFIPFYKQLVHHNAPEIRNQVLQNISQYSDIDLTEQVKELIGDENHDIQVSAMRYLFSRTQYGLPSLYQWIEHPDFKLRSGALLCAAYCYKTDKQFKNLFDLKHYFIKFIEHIHNKNCEDEEALLIKTTLAKVCGIAGESYLYSFLFDLINDICPEVVEYALDSAGKTSDPAFVPIIINHLKSRRMRHIARKALTAYGNRITKMLIENLDNINTDRSIRLQIPKVFEQMGTQESVDRLLEYLNDPDLVLRFRVIKSLNHLRITFPILKFDRQLIEQSIHREAQQYLNTLYFRNTLHRIYFSNTPIRQNQNTTEQTEKIRQLLLNALEERLSEHLEIIFLLLGLEYSPTDMLNAYTAIISDKTDPGANALEYLEHTIKESLRKRIIRIAEYASKRISPDTIQGINQPAMMSEKDLLESLLNESTGWIKACALFLITQSKVSISKQKIENLAKDPDIWIREVAKKALHQ